MGIHSFAVLREKAQTKAIHAERRERDVLRTRVHVIY